MGRCCAITPSLVLAGLLTAAFSLAQNPIGIKIKNPTVCYAHTTDNPCYIPPPEEFLKYRAGARKKTSTIQVIYNPGFSQEAQAAFDYAIDIWESLISSPVTITIDAHWSPLSQNVLGRASYTSAFANFSGAQKLSVFYPIALAEKITGRNLNGNDPEIFIQFNNNIDWHYNPATPPPSGKFDLITVVLHEIGHGLGFSGTFSVSGNNGRVGLQSSGVPIIYDVPIENSTAENLIRVYQSPSENLRTQLVSNNLFFNSATSNRPKLYAPATFSSGSSIGHLDEITYNNTSNALMTPEIAPTEKIHNPGVALNMLKDLGWEMVKLVHLPLTDRENLVDPFLVKTTLVADNGYNAGSVQLNYTTNGTTFTTVSMTPTGNADEYEGTIPATGNAQQYGYYISVNDNAGRNFVNPGKIVRKLNSELQNLFTFETGPDMKTPTITHAPKPFLLESENSLKLDAKVTDNIGIASVIVEYSFNGAPQTPQTLTLVTPETDSIYSVTLNFGTLTNGDEVKYRIIATDNSSNSNQKFSPTSDFYTLNVVGLEPTQDSYLNTFNTPSSDFFGNGFSITQPSGFNDPAIHTAHPYQEGNGFPNNELNFVYQLKVPVRIKANDATLKFDEIVLVEPGENNSVFGTPDFYDYVITEGSKDGGINWVRLGDGYDSRANAAWLTRYNSAISGNISTAVGDPSLFRSRQHNLRDKFDAGDEVVIRFRLFSDPFAAGWGWAIDNLKIQIDDTPPTILHNHIDYLLDDDDELIITTKASDASGIESLKVEYRINGGESTVQEFVVFPPANQYTFTLTGISPLSVGDLIEYKIIGRDSAGNETSFPPGIGFIKVPIISFSAPVSTYAQNFDSPTTDFVGNFFSIAQPAGFGTGAIHSTHFYPNGIGLDNTSSFNFLLKKPIQLSASNSLMRFDEVVIVEGHGGSAVFGTPAFKDYVIVEGSKDGGATWSRFLDGYDIVGGHPLWATAFNSGTNGNSGMFRTRFVDLLDNGNFQTGNEVLIRFRLFADASGNGWGWAIDNLFIQDPITSIENPAATDLKIYPNPITQNIITIEAENAASQTEIEMLSVQGQKLHSIVIESVNGKLFHQFDVSGIPSGMYFIKIQSNEGGKVVRKIIKTN